MRSVFIVILILTVIKMNAQLKPEVALQTFNNHYPTEKIYLQYAKTELIAGEVIWFRSYVFSNSSLTQLSTNLYVELYSQNNEVIDKLIVPLDNGVGQGSFLLKEDLPEGVYYIRAYTKWSLNFNYQLPYLHSLVVYNPKAKNRLVEKAVRWTAYAYPESGSLYEGVTNKVAIRLFSKTKLPESWSAFVTEKTNESAPVVIAKSLNREIGQFQFTPNANSIYQVRVVDNLGNEQILQLPQVKKKGLSFQVKSFPNTVRFIVSLKGLPLNNTSYTVIGQMYNQMVYKAILKPKDSVVIANIPTEKLENGIIHLSLFNSNNEVVAERLSFVLKDDLPNLDLNFDSISFQERAFNRLFFDIDSFYAPTFTVLVTDTTSVKQKETLLSSLWLSNDITTSVDDPSYYFDKANANRLDALDAILISEKWRWFNWSEIMNDKLKPILYKADNYLSFTGTVFLNKRMQLNKTLNIFIKKDSSFVFTQANTDSTGSFTLEGVRFIDTAQIFYQLNSRKADAKFIKAHFEDNNKFERYNGKFPESPYYLVPRKADDSLSTYLQAKLQAFENQKSVDRRYKQLEEVIVKAKQKSAKEKLNDRLSSPMFQSIDERVYDLTDARENKGGFMDVIEWARNRVPGLSSLPYYRQSIISVYVDEVLTDFSFARIPLSDIAMVKFLPTPSGTIANNSALMIYTKRGNYETGFLSGLPNAKLAGYRSIIPFPQVDFANDLYKSFSSDTREVLYWNTNVQADNVTNIPVRFYNNDRSKSFRVLIMGFDQNGKPVFHESILSTPHL
ncbi:MAG TPA: hypothetical protein VEX63_08075 [Flavisolibacter sp.]|nr:hypothetical protein [Flavisolibacter sp.]